MRLFLFLILSSLLWSCSAANRAASPQSFVQGVIQLARVRNAKIEVFLLIGQGVTGPKIAQTFTNDSGEYQLRLSRQSSPLLIISTGGSYIDEASQQTKTAPELSTIVEASMALDAPLTPISTLMKERTIHLIQTQNLVPAQARELAKSQVATLFGLSSDEVDILPADPSDTNGASEKAVKSAVAIAAFSHFIENNFNQQNLSSILQTLKEDFQDGQLDNGGPVAEAWAEKMLEAKQNALDNAALDFADFKAGSLANAMSFHPGTPHVFVNGTKLSGFCANSGLGCQTGSFYQNGILAQGSIAGICYKDGRPHEGLAEQSSACTVGICYSNGLPFSGIYNSAIQRGNCENGSSYQDGLWIPQPPPEDNSSDNPPDSGGSGPTEPPSTCACSGSADTFVLNCETMPEPSKSDCIAAAHQVAACSLTANTQDACMACMFYFVPTWTCNSSNGGGSSGGSSSGGGGGTSVCVSSDVSIPACSGNCYDEASNLAVGTERQGPDNVLMKLTLNAAGFKIWKEKCGEKILNATGLVTHGWQKALDRAGTDFEEFLTSASVIDQVAGRVCPPHVFLKHTQMTVENRCLYFDNGNAAQNLNASNGIEAVDWLNFWNTPLTGRGALLSYYEGNIKVCADKSMRLPTMYETTMDKPTSLPTADQSTNGGSLTADPIWAGSLQGVPDNGTWTWTASAYFDPYYSNGYWQWNGTSSSGTGLAESPYPIRCVLPSHASPQDPPPPPPPPEPPTEPPPPPEPQWCVTRTEFYQTSYAETRTGVDPCIELCGSPMTNNYCGCWEVGSNGNAWIVQPGACEPPPPPSTSSGTCSVSSWIGVGFNTINRISEESCVGAGMIWTPDNEGLNLGFCGQAYQRASCSEYYGTTELNGLAVQVIPINEAECPDAAITAAAQAMNSTECSAIGAQYPHLYENTFFTIQWIPH